MSNLLNIKDQSGNWIPIPVVTNGIKSITQNQDYTLTITLNDGTTYTTTSIKGEDGQDYVLTEQDKQDIAGLVDTPVDDVQINGQSIVESGVANVPIASTIQAGVMKVNGTGGHGLAIENQELLTVSASSSIIKDGTDIFRPIAPKRQHESTFYGLAKASGDTTQSQSNNPVGQYTDEAKSAIQTMLDVPSKSDIPEVNVDDVRINGASIVTDGVATIPIANADNAGVVKVDTYVNGYSGGIATIYDKLYLIGGSSKNVKNGYDYATPIAAGNQHEATFYGLAKAAGHDEKDSTLSVGTYTDEAKASIKNMLGVEDVDIDSKAPVITETATGSIASFDDGADDMPLQSLVVDINPVQDLHGYDHPWVGGGGKNKFPGASDIGGSSSRYGLTWIPQEDGGMKISGTVDTATWLYSDRYIDFEKFYGFSIGDTIAVSGKDTAGDYMTAIHFYNGSTLLVSLANGNSAVIPEGTTRVRLLFYAKGSAPGVVGETINNTVYMQVESGSTATDWTPYENICPISGRTGVAVQRTGKNLFPHQNIAVYTWDFSQKYALYDAINPVFLKANTTYTLTIDSGNKLYRMRFWDASGTLIRDYANVPMIVSGPSMGLQYYDNYKFYAYENVNPATNVCTITPVVDTWMDMVVQSTASSKNQLELGSTATDYEPYSEQTYTIIFPTEAGTVYGAYVDVTGGELVVDRAMVDLGTLNWLYTSEATYPRFSAMVEGAKGYDGGVTAKGVCSVYPIVSQNEGYRGTKTKCIAIVGGGYVWAWDSAYTDAESFKTAMSGVQLVYELAEPIHYPLTPNQINSLYGQNNIWADTGNSEVTYRADTELYINKQIPDVPVDDVQINGESILQDGVANIPIFSANNYGVVMVDTVYGITKSTNGKLQTYAAPQGQIKDGTTYYRPIVPVNQHQATFYGLAKAAGHDEKNSTLSVGEYTSEAKTAIKQMLGVKDDYDSLVIEVSGTDPVITGKASYRYNCGELYTLSITPPSSGTMDIIFTSGATPTVLTLPETVKMPDWWAGIETNTTYEMCITDGVYCGVMSWAT